MRLFWDTTRERFTLECAFAQASTARNAGFIWDRTQRAWWTRSSILVGNLRGTPGLTTSREALFQFAKHDLESKQAIEQSRALSADFPIPVPGGLSYLSFQNAGIKYALSRKDTCFGDEMGIGKSVQGVGISNGDQSCRRVLIVCPAFLKDNWLREFTKWDVKGLSISVVRTGRNITKTKTVGGTKTKIVDEMRFPSADVIIINYELLEDWRKDIRHTLWDLAIFDECHFLKNNKADRTKEVFGCRARFEEVQEAIEPIQARRRLFLSGTPILNKPRELWPLLHSIDPQDLGRDRMYFERRYCDGKMIPIIPKCRLLLNGKAPETLDTSQFRQVWSAVGSTNAQELQDRMRSKFMIRRLRADVLPMLPAKRRQIIVVQAEGVSKLLERERKTYEEYGQDLADIDVESPEFAKISAVRKEIGAKKIPFIIDRAKEVLSETNKVVIFAHHHEVIDGISREFGDACAVVDGRVPNDDRQRLVDRFQEDPRCRIFLGTIGAAGVGFTLTSAWIAIFGELDWKPSTISQAEDRLCRIGQTQGVLIQHIVLAGSMDERQVQLIIQKQEVADRNLDTQEAA